MNAVAIAWASWTPATTAMPVCTSGFTPVAWAAAMAAAVIAGPATWVATILDLAALATGTVATGGATTGPGSGMTTWHVSSVSSPRAVASPGDRSAIRPVCAFGPQSTGRADVVFPLADTVTVMPCRNDRGVCL